MLLLSGCIHADTVGDAYTVVGFLPEATSTTFHEPEDVVDDGRGERPRVKSSTAGSSMVVEDLCENRFSFTLCNLHRDVYINILRAGHRADGWHD